jgi:integrase
MHRAALAPRGTNYDARARSHRAGVRLGDRARPSDRDNPACWKGHLAEALPARAKAAKNHHAALPYAELPAFMVALRHHEGVAARALEFTILTAARTSEVTGAQWDEFDLEAGVWTVPARRMKAGKEHRVPLSPRAVELLQQAYREEGSQHVFIGPAQGGGLSGAAMARVLKRLRDDAVVHGFRSSFSDWSHEQTAFANHVIELSLAHSVGSSVEKAYRRGDLFEKRAKLMSAWATYCSSEPTKVGTVVSLRGAAT